MSKRYGRNQKRRNREEIARLVKERNSIANMASDYLLELHMLREAIKDARTMLGEYSAFLPAKTVPMRNVPSHPWNVSLSNDPSTESMIARFRLAVMQAMALSSKEMLEDYGGVHFEIRMPDGCVSYAVDNQAIINTPEHILAKRMAWQIAAMLTKELKKLKGRAC